MEPQSLEETVRLYQRNAANSIAKCWAEGMYRIILQSPTGSGKTLTAVYMIERAVKNGNRVLFLAHRRRLVEQIAKTCKRFGIRYGVIMAGLPDDDRGKEWAVNDPSAPVQVASRDTLLSREIRNEYNGIPQADLLFVGEVHNLESKQYLRLAQSCRIPYWIGLSATPVRPDGKGLGKKNFDGIVTAATVSDLIAHDPPYLVPVKCFAPPGVGAKRKAGEKVTVAGDPVAHWKRYAEGLSTVAFCNNIAEANRVADLYRKAGIPAEAISAETKQEDRDAIFDRVESGKTLVLTNVFLMTEGVDIPRLACCQILRKCGSFVQFMQAIGRVMRPWQNPETGLWKEYAILLDHSAAVMQHGFPDEPVEWTLSEDDDLDARLKKDKEDGKRKNPVCCAKCGALYSGAPFCPECQTPTPRKEKKEDPKLAQERLVQINGEPEEDRKRRMQAQWQIILRQCAAKGQPVKVASARFRQQFGDYPNRLGVQPSPVYDHKDMPVAEAFPQFARRTPA